jgi:hypothetical protein
MPGRTRHQNSGAEAAVNRQTVADRAVLALVHRLARTAARVFIARDTSHEIEQHQATDERRAAQPSDAAPTTRRIGSAEKSR